MSAAAEPEYAEEIDENVIAEEFKVWKKNAPFLYDVVITNGLDWPSLTCQWLPKRKEIAGGDYVEHQLILGTHTSGGEDNHLMIANVRLPSEDAVIDARKYDEEKGELGGYGGSNAKVEIAIRINHEREVNRARYCPQNHFLIATKSPSADVLVFDWSKHPSAPTDSSVRPNLRLKGHEKEGYGIAWSPFEQGRIVSAGDDHLVCMWDIGTGNPAGAGAASSSSSAGAASSSSSSSSKSSSSSSSSSGTVLQATRKFTAHTGVVEDVSWHRHHKDLFASCADDKQVYIWDLRDGGAAPKLGWQAHDDDVMGLSFSPFNEHYLLSCSADKTVKLWDTRKTDAPIAVFESHTDLVSSVAWSPFNESVFASCSADRRVFVWDCARIGQEQPEEDAEDGPPELLFVHGGHTSKISDFSWSETEDWVIASVAEDNILQVWQMAENIYNEDEEGEEGDSSDEEDESDDEAPAAPPPAKRAKKIADADVE